MGGKISLSLNPSLDPVIIERRSLIEKVIDQLLPKSQAEILMRKSLLNLIYEEELKKLSEQIDRYQLDKTGTTTITYRVAKGLPYIVWGLNAGVCVGQDIELFKDPNFILVPIFDEDDIARGAIYFYRAQGKLFLAGIHPDTVFLEDKDPDEILKVSLDIAYDIAKELGYKRFYIPIPELIHSNRAAIKKAIRELIAELGLNEQPIQKVKWQKEPRDYSFSSVWEFNNTTKSVIFSKASFAGRAQPLLNLMIEKHVLEELDRAA